MRFLFRRAVGFGLGGLVLFAVATPALAADTSSSEFVIIREGDVFGEDLYAGAISVLVEGTIDGDLIAFAAEEVVINGTVTGSVNALSPDVTVNGEVGGSLRVVGNRLTVTGDIGDDVVAAVVNADLSSTSSVGGDLLLWSWNAEALGTIGGDFTGSQRHLDLAGEVDGDVDVSVTRLTVVGDLSVAGDLGYRSDTEAMGLDQANVGGAVVEKTPLAPNLRIRALGVIGRLLVVVFLSVAALTAAYVWPDRTTGAIGEVGNRPVRRWLVGALIIFSPLIAMAIAGVILGLAPAAAALPLLVVLAPVVLALFGVVFALALMAGVPTAGWLGGVLFKRLGLYGSILVGSILVGVLWYLPVVGWLIPLVVLPLGLGAWIAALRGPDIVDAHPPT